MTREDEIWQFKEEIKDILGEVPPLTVLDENSDAEDFYDTELFVVWVTWDHDPPKHSLWHGLYYCPDGHYDVDFPEEPLILGFEVNRDGSEHVGNMEVFEDNIETALNDWRQRKRVEGTGNEGVLDI